MPNRDPYPRLWRAVPSGGRTRNWQSNVSTGEMWAQIAKAAQDKLKAGANGAADRFKAKLVTGRFFMERVLPESATQLKRIQTGAASIMELPAEAF